MDTLDMVALLKAIEEEHHKTGEKVILPGNVWSMYDIALRLEDLYYRVDSLLKERPYCSVGDTLYYINTDISKQPIEVVVDEITYRKDGFTIIFDVNDVATLVTSNDIEKTVFKNKNRAKKMLKKG